MNIHDVKKVAVIGCGLMGQQISMNAAISGYQVALFDNFEQARAKAAAWAEEYLAGRIAKGRLTAEQVEDVKRRYTICETLEDAAGDADLVIEAIIESQEAKENLFRQLDPVVRKDTIIATNSSFMVSSLFADCISNPSRLANAHYYNPALVMKFVEVVRGPHTSDETAKTLMDFCTNCGKTPVLMKKELPGFLANMISEAMYNACWYLLENDYCTFKDIDIACENGLGHKMGPFRKIDLTGVDLAYQIHHGNLERTGVKDPGYDILKELYEQGRYGMKNGKGFYDYT